MLPFLIPLIPVAAGALLRAAPLLQSTAILAGAGAMAGWAISNVYQTGEISKDNAERLAYNYEYLQHQRNELRNQDDYLQFLSDKRKFEQDIDIRKIEAQEDYLVWEQEKFAYSIEQDTLDYQRDIAKIAAVGAFDAIGDIYDANMQTQRLQAQADMQVQELQQDEIERNIYLQEKAFTATHTILQQYGTEEDLFKLTYIISELKKLLPVEEKRLDPKTDDESRIPADAQNYDYALWDDVPE